MIRIYILFAVVICLFFTFLCLGACKMSGYVSRLEEVDEEKRKFENAHKSSE